MYELFAYYGTRTFELFSAFLIVLIFLRIFGVNYQLKQMTALDLIINFMLGAILGAFIMDDNITIFHFILIMAIYIIMVYATNMIIKKTDWGRRMLVGTPKIIIKDGKVDERMVNRLNITIHDIASALRQQDVRSLTEVKMAQIEPDGDLTIVKKGDSKYSTILIDNGVVDELALSEIRKSDKWLAGQLAARKIKDPDEVFIAQWHKGRLHIVKKS